MRKSGFLYLSRYRCCHRGFSVIEGLVAIFVLSVGILAVASLFAQSFVQTSKDSRRVTALALAQEGAELMRVLHNDDVVQASNSFFGKIDTGTLGKDPNHCRVEIDFGYPQEVKYRCYLTHNNSNYVLGVPDLTSLYYKHTSSSVSSFPRFWRRIYVEATSDTERRIVSVVFYKMPSVGDWPTIGSQAKTKCTADKGCAFAEIVLYSEV